MYEYVNSFCSAVSPTCYTTEGPSVVRERHYLRMKVGGLNTNKYLLSALYVPGRVLDARDTGLLSLGLGFHKKPRVIL